MAKISSLTLAQLERAVAIKRQIEALQKELDSMTDNGAPALPAKRGRKPRLTVADVTEAPKKKSKFSPATRAKMAAAQKARWAKFNGTADATPAPVADAEVVADEPRKKRKVSRAAKAKMAAAQKARWAKFRAEKAS